MTNITKKRFQKDVKINKVVAYKWIKAYHNGSNYISCFDCLNNCTMAYQLSFLVLKIKQIRIRIVETRRLEARFVPFVEFNGLV